MKSGSIGYITLYFREGAEVECIERHKLLRTIVKISLSYLVGPQRLNKDFFKVTYQEKFPSWENRLTSGKKIIQVLEYST